MYSLASSRFLMTIGILCTIKLHQVAANLNATSDISSSVLVLVPSGTNLTESGNPDERFNLFKLDTSVLWQQESDGAPEGEGTPSNIDERMNDDSMVTSEMLSGHRESRKMNLLRGLWNKPKASPLYLVNGTVCRFVNSLPICTTLSTTGLLPSGSSSGGGLSNTQNRPSGQSGGQSSVQFANNQNLRPAALMDDDSQDINVEAQSPDNSNTTRVQQAQQQVTKPVSSPQMVQARPLGLLVNSLNRRPINFIGIRRPVRQYQISQVSRSVPVDIGRSTGKQSGSFLFG